MFGNTHVQLLRLLLEKRRNGNELAEALKLSPGTVSSALKKLRQAGFLTEDNEWADTAAAADLKQILVRYRVLPLEWLKNANLPILAFIAQKPATIEEIRAYTGHSIPTIYLTLRNMRSYSLLSKAGKKYGLSSLVPEIADFLRHWQAHVTLKELGLPGPANYRGTLQVEAIFSLPAEIAPQKGTPTAFSRFAESGIEVISGETYYAVRRKPGGGWESIPENLMSPEKILEHARFVANAWREKGFCVLYYVKNRDKLLENPDFERILRGESVEGWPLLKDLIDMADVYGIALPQPAVN